MNEITREDIISYINQNFQVKVSVQDLSRPNGSFVVRVCNLFLAGFGLQQTDQPCFSARINCPPSSIEIPRETQLMINVYQKVFKIVQKVNFQVLITDFTQPNQKRIHALLIALCQCHARYINIANELDELRQKYEQIYDEKLRLQTELVDSKSEHEGACIALNTLNAKETDAQKAEIPNLEDELSRMKLLISEETLKLKNNIEENRKTMDQNSYYEIEIAKKTNNIHIESEKIIRSPMKTIDAANNLRTRRATLEADLKELSALENKHRKVYAKDKELGKDIYKQFSLKIASILCELDKARAPHMNSKQLEEEIHKTKQDLNSIVSQVSVQRRDLDSLKATQNQALDKIKSQNKSLNELITCFLNDLPIKKKSLEDLTIDSNRLDEDIDLIAVQLSSLPERIATIRDKYNL